MSLRSFNVTLPRTVRCACGERHRDVEARAMADLYWFDCRCGSTLTAAIPDEELAAMADRAETLEEERRFGR